LAPGAPEHAAGQDARKYSTSNPVVVRLIDRWLARLRQLVPAAGSLMVDVGVGEGLALERSGVVGSRPVLGIDYRFDKLAAAAERLPTLTGARGDAGMVPVRSGAVPLVTSIEVLEHLVTPDAAVAELARICSETCVVSVPWEPWFRLGNLARGKNLRGWGNDPEHVQQFTPARLHRLMAPHFASVEVHRCFPWLIAVASGPRRPG
jgi:ubiquinone/menaquinone biosynthesis C-methylase UbiE